MPCLHEVIYGKEQETVTVFSPNKYSKAHIKGILGFLVDNIYVVFGNQVFQQSVGIPIGTNLFLYSYEAEFVQKLLRDNSKKTSRILQPYI
jgi:hypothetical protein